MLLCERIEMHAVTAEFRTPPLSDLLCRDNIAGGKKQTINTNRFLQVIEFVFDLLSLAATGVRISFLLVIFHCVNQLLSSFSPIFTIFVLYV